jgi:hypothetical protein
MRPPVPRHSSYVPLIALSVTLAVLITAIVVVSVAKSRVDTGGPTGPTPTGLTPSGPTPTGSGPVDSCVVGSWRVTSHREDVLVPDVGDVPLTGSGTRVRLAADGTGVTDYGTGTPFTGESGGTRYTLTISGTVRFGYRTTGDMITFSDLAPDGRVVLTADGAELYRDRLAGSADAARYTCVGAALTQFTGRYTVEMARQQS